MRVTVKEAKTQPKSILKHHEQKKNKKELRQLWINPHANEMRESKTDLSSSDCEYQLLRAVKMRRGLQILAKVCSQTNTAVKAEDEEEGQSARCCGGGVKLRKDTEEQTESTWKAGDRSQSRERSLARKNYETRDKSRRCAAYRCRFKTFEELKSYKELRSIYTTRPKSRQPMYDNDDARKRATSKDENLEECPGSASDNETTTKPAQHKSRKDVDRSDQKRRHHSSSNSAPSRNSMKKSLFFCCGGRAKFADDQKRRAFEAYKPVLKNRAAPAECALTLAELKQLKKLRALYTRRADKRQRPLPYAISFKIDTHTPSKYDVYRAQHRSQPACEQCKYNTCRDLESYIRSCREVRPTGESQPTETDAQEQESFEPKMYQAHKYTCLENGSVCDKVKLLRERNDSEPRKSRSAELRIKRKKYMKTGISHSDSSVYKTSKPTPKGDKQVRKPLELPDDSDTEKTTGCSCFRRKNANKTKKPKLEPEPKPEPKPKQKPKPELKPKQKPKPELKPKPKPIPQTMPQPKRDLRLEETPKPERKPKEQPTKPPKLTKKTSSTTDVEKKPTSCCPTGKKDKPKKLDDTVKKPSKAKSRESVKKEPSSKSSSCCPIGRTKEKPKKSEDNKRQPTKAKSEESVKKKPSKTDKPNIMENPPEQPKPKHSNEEVQKKPSRSGEPKNVEKPPKEKSPVMPSQKNIQKKPSKTTTVEKPKEKPTEFKKPEKVQTKKSETTTDCFSFCKKNTTKTVEEKPAKPKEKPLKSKQEKKIEKKPSATKPLAKIKESKPEKKEKTQTKPAETTTDCFSFCKKDKTKAVAEKPPKPKDKLKKQEKTIKKPSKTSLPDKQVEPKPAKEIPPKPEKLKVEKKPSNKSTSCCPIGKKIKPQTGKSKSSEKVEDKPKKTDDSKKKLTPKKSEQITCCGVSKPNKPKKLDDSKTKIPKPVVTQRKPSPIRTTPPAKVETPSPPPKPQPKPAKAALKTEKASKTSFCSCFESPDEKAPQKKDSNIEKRKTVPPKTKASETSFCSCCTSASKEDTQNKYKLKERRREKSMNKEPSETNPANISYCDMLYNELENIVSHRYECQEYVNNECKKPKKNVCDPKQERRRRAQELEKDKKTNKKELKHQTNAKETKKNRTHEEKATKSNDTLQRKERIKKLKNEASDKKETKPKKQRVQFAKPPPAFAPCYATSDSEIKQIYVPQYVLGKPHKRGVSLAQFKYTVILSSSAKEKCFKNPAKASHKKYFYTLGLDCKK